MNAMIEMPRVGTLSLAEVVERLGGVPLERIRLLDPLGPCSEERYIEIVERKEGLYELVDGILVEKAMGWFPGHVAVVLLYHLCAFVKARGLGIVLGEAGMARVAGQIRMPDVAFYPWSRFPLARPSTSSAILEAVPDLAVEVMSPSNTAREMERKRRENFAGGARLVWEIEPELRLARVFTGPDTFTVVNEQGTLDADPVLPGFRIALRVLFTFEDEAPRTGPDAPG